MPDKSSSVSGSQVAPPFEGRVARVLWLATAVAVWMLAIWYFYRGFFRSGFRLTQGDNGDGRLTEVIASHWQNPLQFSGGITDLGIFYPFGQGLMYSDTMLIFGLIAAPLTHIGIDSSIAFQWSLILVSTIGYFSTVVFLRQGAAAPWPLAIAAGLVVTFSNGLLVASNHPQLIALCLLPLVLGLMLAAHRARVLQLGLIWAFIAGLVLGLTVYTAFYIGWFALASSVLVVLLYSVTAGPGAVKRLMFNRPRHLALAASAGVIPGLTLLIYTYGPLLGESAERPLDEVRQYALSPQDLLAVSPTNVVWFRPLYALFGGMADAEKAMSPTPLLLVTALVLVVLGFLNPQRKSPWLAAGIAGTISGFVLWLSPVAWGDYLPWAMIHALPGAGAIRAIGRVELMANFLLAMSSSIIAAQLWRSRKHTPMARAAGTALLAAIALEQANFLVQQNVDVERVQLVRTIKSPPRDCKFFVLMPPFWNERAEDGQTDAGIVAQEKGIPTWNGGSGGAPSGWNLYGLEEPDTYVHRVKEYASVHGTKGVCALRIPEGLWTPLDAELEGIEPGY